MDIVYTIINDPTVDGKSEIIVKQTSIVFGTCGLINDKSGECRISDVDETLPWHFMYHYQIDLNINRDHEAKFRSNGSLRHNVCNFLLNRLSKSSVVEKLYYEPVNNTVKFIHNYKVPFNGKAVPTSDVQNRTKKLLDTLFSIYTQEYNDFFSYITK